MALRLIATASCLFASTFASPILLGGDQTEGLGPFACSGNPGEYTEPQCWSILNVENFLNDWYRKMPDCKKRHNDTLDSSECCYYTSGQETWSQCFLRSTLNNTQYQCTDMTRSSCQLESATVSESFGLERAARRYVVWAIYLVYSFFNDWYFAVTNAVSAVAPMCASIIGFINPVVPHNVDLNNILGVLGAGLAMLPFAPLLDGVGAIAQMAATAAINAVVQAPQVGRLIWPVGTIESRFDQTAKLEDNLRRASTEMQKRLNSALGQAMQDLPSFLNMTRSGAFSGAHNFSLFNSTDSVKRGLLTFVTSLAIANNGWDTFWGPDMTDDLTSTNESQTRNYGCQMQSNGACYHTGKDKGKMKQPPGWVEYTSSAVNRSFTIAPYFLKKAKYTPAEMLNKIVDEGWADLGLMFESSYNCSMLARRVSFYDRSPKVEFLNDGTLSYQCIGQLNMVDGCSGNTPWSKAVASPRTCTSFFDLH